MSRLIHLPSNHPSGLKTVRLGRHRPRARALSLSIARYLDLGALPPAPASVDYSGPANGAIRNVYLNDTLGDCVIAGGYHNVGVASGNAGTCFVASNVQITADYSAIGGYVPGDPSTDNGCDEQTAMNYWVQHGFADGSKLLGWLRVDATSPTLIQQLLYLFENQYFGIELPDAWISPFPSGDGFVWGVAGDADPDNGHCIMGFGYDSQGVMIDTWGMKGVITWAAIAQYCVENSGGELYVWLMADQIAKAAQKAPNGIDWYSLVQDFDSIGGTVPLPVPPPAPPPPAPPGPAPTPPIPPAPVGVTLAQATQWATSRLSNGGFILREQTASLLVSEGLRNNWPK